MLLSKSKARPAVEERQTQYEEAYEVGRIVALSGQKNLGWMHVYDNPPQWVISGFKDGWEAQKKAESVCESFVDTGGSRLEMLKNDTV